MSSAKSAARAVPHAEATARAVAALRKMTKKELFETFVRAGIYTPDGRLTPEYGGRKKSRPARLKAVAR